MGLCSWGPHQHSHNGGIQVLLGHCPTACRWAGSRNILPRLRLHTSPSRTAPARQAGSRFPLASSSRA
jgi:hypothetical protein